MNLGSPADMWLQFLKCRGTSDAEREPDRQTDDVVGVLFQENMRVHLAVWRIAGST